MPEREESLEHRIIAELQQRAHKAEADNRRLTERVRELTDEIATMKESTWCAYCGLLIKCDDDAASKISKHIMGECPKHPIRIYQRHTEAVEEQNKALTTELAGMRTLIDGAREIVEIFSPVSPAQEEWKHDWMMKANALRKVTP